MTTFNRSEILSAAHESARIYCREAGYRAALAEGLRAAWAEAKLQAALDAKRTRPSSPALDRAIAEIEMIHLKDNLGSADFARVHQLRAQAETLRRAA